MRHLLTFLLFAASAFAQTATITDTIATPFAGTFAGTVTVSLNSPALAQPLYSGNVTLSGWTQTVTVTAGVFTLTLYTNDLITPGGTSYTATYAPTSGSGWRETWIVPTGATTIREIRSTTVPSPSVRFTPSQITQAGATLGQGLRWNGSIWAPADVVANPMTTTGDLITRSGGVPVRVGIGSTGQVLTVAGGLPTWAAPATNGTVTSVSVTTANGVSGTVATATSTPAITLSLGAITPSSVAASGTVTGSNLSGTNTGDQTSITGNAGTATALAANGTNCSAGSFPLGVDASGNSETCTALPTTITGTANQITASGTTGAITLSIPTNPTLPGTTTGTFSGNLTGNVTGNVTGSSGSTTGNAGTATALQTARTIAGVSFNGTANISIPSTGLSDSADIVRGGAALTTVGSVPFVTSSGVLGQSANLFWDSSRLRAGAAAGANGAALVGTTGTLGGIWLNTSTGSPGVTNYVLLRDASQNTILNTETGSYIGFRINNVDFGRVFTSGNWGIGTTTDGNFKLDVADSGSAGGLRVWDQRATIGSTSLVVRAGAGQGSNVLVSFQSAAGAQQSSVDSAGAWRGNFQSIANEIGMSDPGGTFGLGLAFSADTGLNWSNSTSFFSATKDLSLSRNAASALQIGDGGANANGDLLYRNAFLSGTMFLGGGSDGSFLAAGLNFKSTGVFAFSSTTNATATKDLSLSRASANTLQVGDGGANSNGTIVARIHTWTNGTEGTCDSTLRGQVVMVQGGAGVADTFRICRKDTADAYAWTALY